MIGNADPHGLAGEGWAALGKLIAVLAVAAVVVAPAGAAAMTPAEEEFCTPRVLVDYEAPLAGLPKVREPPESRRLPFGPRRLIFSEPLKFRPQTPPGVVVAWDGIRSRLGLVGAAFGDKRLDWKIESRLVRINGSGRDIHLVRRRLDRVGLLEVERPREVGFDHSPEPGLYRYDILFRNWAGDLLGHYHRHIRVVPRVVDIRLALFQGSYRVGDVVHAKLENHGTVGTFYGAPFGIDRFDGTAWVPVKLTDLFGPDVAFPMIGLGTAPGRSGGCSFMGFIVPATMTPGRYRMVKGIEIAPWPSSAGEERTVTAEFTVEPPA